jgi:HK97 family phage portal protein
MQLPAWLRRKQILQPKITDLSQPPGNPTIAVNSLPIFPERNMQNYINAYSTNSTVYTIVSLMAKKFAYLPRYVYEVMDNDSAQKYDRMLRSRNPNMRGLKLEKLNEKAYRIYRKRNPLEERFANAGKAGYKPEDPVDDNGLSKLLNKPNSFQGQDAYYQLLYTYKKLTGNVFVWLNRGINNDKVDGEARYKLPILEMYVLPSQWMTVRVDRTYMLGEIIGYTFMNNGQANYLAKEDVIHWKDPNPEYGGMSYQNLYGISPLAPGMKLLTQDSSARDAAVAMFQNGGTKGVLTQVPPYTQMSKEQSAALDDAVDTKINTRSMKGAVVKLAGQWEYLDMAMNAVDMDLVDASDKVFQRIANLLGANPQLWETQTTFNNVEQARRDLMTNAILPDACGFRDEENRVLLQAFGLNETNIKIDIDPSQQAELQDDIGKMTTTVISNWTLTPNEKRQELGYDEIDDDTMDDIWIPTTLTRMEDAAVQSADLGSYSQSGSADNGDSGGEISDNAR